MEKKVYVLTDITPDDNGTVDIINGSVAVFENLCTEMLPKVLGLNHNNRKELLECWDEKSK